MTSGSGLIAVAIAVSTFGFLNLTMLAPTRVYYAMARDGVFLDSVSRLHPRFGTPSLAIVIQSGWAIALVLTGTYAQLVDYVVFADWIFFGLAGLALFLFRFRIPLSRSLGRHPSGHPLYPIVPAIFALVSIAIVVSVMRSNPVGSLIGIGMLLTGIPVFFLWQRAKPECPGTLPADRTGRYGGPSVPTPPTRSAHRARPGVAPVCRPALTTGHAIHQHVLDSPTDSWCGSSNVARS